MFIRTLEDVQGTERYKVLFDGTTRSARYLAAADGMGFSLHINRVDASPPVLLWDKHHWEANYIVSGTGLVEDLTSGQSWRLEPGVLYNDTRSEIKTSLAVIRPHQGSPRAFHPVRRYRVHRLFRSA